MKWEAGQSWLRIVELELGSFHIVWRAHVQLFGNRYREPETQDNGSSDEFKY